MHLRFLQAIRVALPDPLDLPMGHHNWAERPRWWPTLCNAFSQLIVMHDQTTAQDQPEWMRRRERRREAIRRVRFFIYCYGYLRWLYRPHMRLIHRFGKHWFSVVPMDGRKWCQWCGECRVDD